MNIFKKLFDKLKIKECYSGGTKLALIDKYLVDESDEIYKLIYRVGTNLEEINSLSFVVNSYVKVLMSDKFLECNMRYDQCGSADGWVNLFYLRSDNIYRISSDLKFTRGYSVPNNIAGYVLSILGSFREFMSKFPNYITKIESNPKEGIMKVFIYKNDNGIGDYYYYRYNCTTDDYCDNKDNCITDDENLVAKLTYAFK